MSIMSRRRIAAKKSQKVEPKQASVEKKGAVTEQKPAKPNKPAARSK